MVLIYPVLFLSADKVTHVVYVVDSESYPSECIGFGIVYGGATVRCIFFFAHTLPYMIIIVLTHKITHN